MVLKNWFLTVYYLGRCSGPQRARFVQFILWDGVVVLKVLIFLQLILWEGVVVLKELILKVSTLGGCAGHERTDF